MPRTMPVVLETRKFSEISIRQFRKDLLGWYDLHARVLPWRARYGQTADPYHVWLSEVMLQQTTVPAVIPYFGKFVDKWPTIHNLADAADDDVMQAWAGLGYYARARNLLKCARVVSRELGGVFPDTPEALQELPGIGDYTSAAIAAIAFNRVATVIDGNVDRVVSRWFAIEEPLPDSKAEIRRLATFLFESDGVKRPGDFAQAMMDLGATVCIPKTPRCGVCPVSANCSARIAGIAANLPRKKEKAIRPSRYGYIYWIENERGEVLVEKRADKGLLGGMTGFPTTEWVQRSGKEIPIVNHISAIHMGDDMQKDKNLRVRHVFTHFELELQGIVMAAPKDFIPADYQRWHPVQDIHTVGFPTVFKKFLRLVAGSDTKR